MMKALNLAGSFELWSEWKRHSQGLIHLAVQSALTTAQFESQPPKVVIFLRMDFDYNLLTFRPIEPSEVVRMSDLPDIVGQDDANAVMEHYESIRAKIQRNSADAHLRASKIHFAFLRCFERWSVIPMTSEDVPRHDWEEVQRSFSSKLNYKTHPTDPWVGQKMATVKAQFERLSAVSRLCRVCAPRLPPFQWATDPPHAWDRRSLRACVWWGKIGRLVKYKSMTLENMRETLPIVDEFTKRDVLSGEDSLSLRESRKRSPHTILIPVVYVNTQAGAALCFPNFFESNPGLFYDDPVKQCNKMAAEHFCALQRFQFPDVISPDLC